MPISPGFQPALRKKIDLDTIYRNPLDEIKDLKAQLEMKNLLIRELSILNK
jgi:hypothetical protein